MKQRQRGAVADAVSGQSTSLSTIRFGKGLGLGPLFRSMTWRRRC